MFWKVNLLHSWIPMVFFFFLPLLFLRQCRHCDVPEMPFRSHATITAVASASSLMFHTLISPLPAPVLTHPLSPFSLSLKKKKKFEHFLSHADVWCWCGKHPLHSPWFSLENQGARRPLTQGSRWGVRWSWAPSPAPHGVRAWLRQHIIHILKASWTESIEHKESKETYHPRPHPTSQ